MLSAARIHLSRFPDQTTHCTYGRWGLRSIRDKHYVVVMVQLFRYLDFPVYEIDAGEASPDLRNADPAPDRLMRLNRARRCAFQLLSVRSFCDEPRVRGSKSHPAVL
jgi:hypothetical protein